MRVVYDSEHDASAVEFDEDDTIFISTTKEGKMHISSCKGGKPEMVEEQLLFSLDEVEGGNNEEEIE